MKSNDSSTWRNHQLHFLTSYSLNTVCQFPQQQTVYEVATSVLSSLWLRSCQLSPCVCVCFEVVVFFNWVAFKSDFSWVSFGRGSNNINLPILQWMVSFLQEPCFVSLAKVGKTKIKSQMLLLQGSAVQVEVSHIHLS